MEIPKRMLERFKEIIAAAMLLLPEARWSRDQSRARLPAPPAGAADDLTGACCSAARCWLAK